MAKSKPYYECRFNHSVGKGGAFCYVKVAYNRLKGLSDNALHFIHFERKGNSWLLLDGMQHHGGELVKEIKFDRPEVGNPGVIIHGVRREITKYTVQMVDGGKEFYHLDELPDGTWRITHSNTLMMSWNDVPIEVHNQLTHIEIVEEIESVHQKPYRIFALENALYCPNAKEPSPFLCESIAAEENPWTLWYVRQHTTKTAQGSTTPLDLDPIGEMNKVKERLRADSEKIKAQNYIMFREPEIAVGPYREVSLEWVIWYHMKTGFNYERCHRFGIQKMQQERSL